MPANIGFGCRLDLGTITFRRTRPDRIKRHFNGKLGFPSRLVSHERDVRLTKHFAQSLCEDARKLDQFSIYRLGASDDVCERRSRDLIFLIADQYASLTIAQGLDGIDPQPGSQQAIEGAGRSAAHDVPERGGAQLKTYPLLIGVEISEDFGGIF